MIKKTPPPRLEQLRCEVIYMIMKCLQVCCADNRFLVHSFSFIMPVVVCWDSDGLTKRCCFARHDPVIHALKTTFFCQINV